MGGKKELRDDLIREVKDFLRNATQAGVCFIIPM